MSLKKIFQRFQMIPADSKRLQMIPADPKQLQMILPDPKQLQMSLTDSKRFLLILQTVIFWQIVLCVELSLNQIK